MRPISFLALLFFVSIFSGQASAYDPNAHRAVRLTDVPNLVLSNNKMTTARRVAPIPQMSCVGGHCNVAYMPTTMQCQNTGHNGVDVTWKCTADMHPGYKLGETNVVCEGFNYPEDPFILAGSCGVEYRLEQNLLYVQPPLQTTTTTITSAPMYHTRSYYDDGFGVFFFCVIVLICIIALCNCPAGGTVHHTYGNPYYSTPPIIVGSGFSAPSRTFVTTTTSSAGSALASATSSAFANTKRR